MFELLTEFTRSVTVTPEFCIRAMSGTMWYSGT